MDRLIWRLRGTGQFWHHTTTCQHTLRSKAVVSRPSLNSDCSWTSLNPDTKVEPIGASGTGTLFRTWFFCRLSEAQWLTKPCVVLRRVGRGATERGVMVVCGSGLPLCLRSMTGLLRLSCIPGIQFFPISVCISKSLFSSGIPVISLTTRTRLSYVFQHSPMHFLIVS